MRAIKTGARIVRASIFRYCTRRIKKNAIHRHRQRRQPVNHNGQPTAKATIDDANDTQLSSIHSY